MRAEDEVDAAVGLERPHVQVAPQLAHLVDADLVAERLQHVKVGVRRAPHALVAVEQRRSERPRSEPLADPRRAVEEVGVRRLVRERARQQALRLVLLDDRLEGHRTDSTARQTSAATSARSRSPASPATETTRQRSGSRAARSR